MDNARRKGCFEIVSRYKAYFRIDFTDDRAIFSAQHVPCIETVVLSFLNYWQKHFKCIHIHCTNVIGILEAKGPLPITVFGRYNSWLVEYLPLLRMFFLCCSMCMAIHACSKSMFKSLGFIRYRVFIKYCVFFS